MKKLFKYLDGKANEKVAYYVVALGMIVFSLSAILSVFVLSIVSENTLQLIKAEMGHEGYNFIKTYFILSFFFILGFIYMYSIYFEKIRKAYLKYKSELKKEGEKEWKSF